MILIPDIETAFVDPFFTDPTLVLICDIQDPITGQKYDKDPRYVAKKAEDKGSNHPYFLHDNLS